MILWISTTGPNLGETANTGFTPDRERRYHNVVVRQRWEGLGSLRLAAGRRWGAAAWRRHRRAGQG